MDNNKENVAEQKSQRELSDASTVKTPLVDALRRYFNKTVLAVDVFVDGDKVGQMQVEANTSNWHGVYGTNG